MPGDRQPPLARGRAAVAAILQPGEQRRARGARRSSGRSRPSTADVGELHEDRGEGDRQRARDGGHARSPRRARRARGLADTAGRAIPAVATRVNPSRPYMRAMSSLRPTGTRCRRRRWRASATSAAVTARAEPAPAGGGQGADADDLGHAADRLVAADRQHAVVVLGHDRDRQPGCACARARASRASGSARGRRHARAHRRAGVRARARRTRWSATAPATRASAGSSGSSRRSAGVDGGRRRAAGRAPSAAASSTSSPASRRGRRERRRVLVTHSNASGEPSSHWRARTAATSSAPNVAARRARPRVVRPRDALADEQPQRAVLLDARGRARDRVVVRLDASSSRSAEADDPAAILRRSSALSSVSSSTPCSRATSRSVRPLAAASLTISAALS